MKYFFIILLLLIIDISTKECDEVVFSSKDSCTSASVSSDYYKCCYNEGTIDLTTTSEHVLNLLQGEFHMEQKSLLFCKSLTKNDYDDIDYYIENHKHLEYSNGETVYFDSVSVDCLGVFLKKSIIFFILLTFII